MQDTITRILIDYYRLVNDIMYLLYYIGSLLSRTI